MSIWGHPVHQDGLLGCKAQGTCGKSKVTCNCRTSTHHTVSQIASLPAPDTRWQSSGSRSQQQPHTLGPGPVELRQNHRSTSVPSPLPPALNPLTSCPGLTLEQEAARNPCVSKTLAYLPTYPISGKGKKACRKRRHPGSRKPTQEGPHGIAI